MALGTVAASRDGHSEVLSCLPDTQPITVARMATAGFQRPRPAGTIGKHSGVNLALSGHAGALRHKYLPDCRAT